MYKSKLFEVSYKVANELRSSVLGDLSLRANKRTFKKNDDGALLVEVLVALFVLVLVFTMTSAALSSTAEKRIEIEQRDRALAILASYEEQSRIFRCGLAVDRVDAQLSASSFQNSVAKCDFKAIAEGTTPANSGDQDFELEELINPDNGAMQTFDVSIRYWWEVPGTNVHDGQCSGLVNLASNSDLTDDLPAILTRAIQIRWDEKGVEYEEHLIKRDPVPVDDVVFASGNRVSLVTPVEAGDNRRLYPVSASTAYYIQKKIDGLLGQPTICAWFAYLTPDSQSRRLDSTNFTLGIGAGQLSSKFVEIL